MTVYRVSGVSASTASATALHVTGVNTTAISKR
jgi:hypothetical protein